MEHAQLKKTWKFQLLLSKKLPPSFPKLREHQENPLNSRRNPSPSTIQKTWKNEKLPSKKSPCRSPSALTSHL
jgi:hypothetical protein